MGQHNPGIDPICSSVTEQFPENRWDEQDGYCLRYSFWMSFNLKLLSFIVTDLFMPEKPWQGGPPQSNST
jgi:hypothetical protein